MWWETQVPGSQGGGERLTLGSQEGWGGQRLQPQRSALDKGIGSHGLAGSVGSSQLPGQPLSPGVLHENQGSACCRGPGSRVLRHTRLQLRPEGDAERFQEFAECELRIPGDTVPRLRGRRRVRGFLQGKGGHSIVGCLRGRRCQGRVRDVSPWHAD